MTSEFKSATRLLVFSIIYSFIIAILPNDAYSETITPSLSESGDWSCRRSSPNCEVSQYRFSAPASEITSPLITDDNINTGVVLYGQDGSTEFGAFARFEFNVSSDIDSLSFNISASPNLRSPLNVAWLAFFTWNYDTNDSTYFYQNHNFDIADGIDSFSFTFTPYGNDGNKDTTVNLNNIISDTGTVRFMVSGPFDEGQGNLGVPELYLNEVNITTTTIVPEPISSLLFVTGATLLAGRRFIRQKKRT